MAQEENAFDSRSNTPQESGESRAAKHPQYVFRAESINRSTRRCLSPVVCPEFTRAPLDSLILPDARKRRREPRSRASDVGELW